MKKIIVFLIIAISAILVISMFGQTSSYALTQKSATEEIDLSQAHSNGDGTVTYNIPISLESYLDENETLSISGAANKKIIVYTETNNNIYTETNNNFQMAYTLTNQGIDEANFYIVEGASEDSSSAIQLVYLDDEKPEYYYLSEINFSDANEDGNKYRIGNTQYYVCLDETDPDNNNVLFVYDSAVGFTPVTSDDYKQSLGDGSYYFKVTYNGKVYHCQSLGEGAKDPDNIVNFNISGADVSISGVTISVFDAKESELLTNNINKVIYNDKTIYQLILQESFNEESITFDVFSDGADTDNDFTLNIKPYKEPTELNPPTIEYNGQVDGREGEDNLPVIRLSYEQKDNLQVNLYDLFSINKGEYDRVQINDGNNFIDSVIEFEILGATSQPGAYRGSATMKYTPMDSQGFIGSEQDGGSVIYETRTAEFNFILVIDRPYTSITVHRTDSEGNIIENEPVDVEYNEISENIYFVAITENGDKLSNDEFYSDYYYNEDYGTFYCNLSETTTINLRLLNGGYINYPSLDKNVTINTITITINTIYMKAPEITLRNNIDPISVRRKDFNYDTIVNEMNSNISSIYDPYGEKIDKSTIEYYVIDVDSQEISLNEFVDTKPGNGEYTIYAKVKNQHNNYSDPVTFSLIINVEEPTYSFVFKDSSGVEVTSREFEYGTQRLSIEVAFSNTDDYDSFDVDFITDERYISYSESFDNATQKLTLNLTLNSGLVGAQQCSLNVYGIINEEKSTIYNEPINLNFQILEKPNSAPVIVFTETTINNDFAFRVIKNSYTNLLSYIESVSDDYDDLTISDVEVKVNGILCTETNYRFVNAGETVVTYTLMDTKLLSTSQNIVFTVEETKPSSEDKTFEFSYKENKIISLEDITDQDGDAVYIQFYSKDSTGKWEETYVIRDDKGNRVGAISSNNSDNVFTLVTDNANFVGVLTFKFLPYNIGDNKSVDNAYTCTVTIIDNVAPVVNVNQFISQYYQGQISAEDIKLNNFVTAIDEVDGAITPTISGSVNPEVAGTYNIHYTFVDKSNNKAEKTISINILPIESPRIELVRENFEIKKGEEFNVYDIIYQIVDNDKIYQDNFDKLTNLNIDFNPELDTNKPGEYKIYISYTGQFNNVSEIKEFTLTVQEPPNYTLIIVLSVLGAGAIVGGVFLIRFIVFKRRSRI